MSNKREVVAIIGRPNVGKSTFVNRLVGARKSIVDDSPGVTRDRIYFDVSWCGKDFTIIDTGGIIPGDEDEIMQNIFAQVEFALDEADKIIFMVDAKDGVSPIDLDIANYLRRYSNKKIFLTVNKVDSIEKQAFIYDFYKLALGEPYALSALHGSGGVGDLLDKIVEDMDDECLKEDVEKFIKIAIVGRPNAGKSSIVNALLNENRLIVSDISGTTRDSINSKLKYENENFLIVDTAGIRKKSKVDYGIEKFAVDRSIRSIKDCDVAVLVIDATIGLTDQDKKISQIIVESGKGIILAINKWDIVENKDAYSTSKYNKKIESEAFLNFVPKIFISAKTKQRLNNIFIEAKKVYENYTRRISTSLLNKIINEAYVINPPVSFKGKRLKIYYSTQILDSPPTFIIFINDKKLIKESYKRYLENQLREAFNFVGVPFRISFRERGEDKRK